MNSKQLDDLIAASKTVCKAGAHTLNIAIGGLRDAGKAYDEYVEEQSKPTHQEKRPPNSKVRLVMVGVMDSDDARVVIFENAEGETVVALEEEWKDDYEVVSPIPLIKLKQRIIREANGFQFDGAMETINNLKDLFGDRAEVTYQTEPYYINTVPRTQAYRIKIRDVTDGDTFSAKPGDWIILDASRDIMDAVPEISFGDLGYSAVVT